MGDEELIARLREIQGQAGLFASTAADRIEALVKERDEALEWLSASQGYIADAVFALDKQEKAEARAEAAEAEVEKLLAERDRYLRHLTAGAESLNAYKARAEAAEAKVERLRKTLRIIGGNNCITCSAEAFNVLIAERHSSAALTETATTEERHDVD